MPVSRRGFKSIKQWELECVCWVGGYKYLFSGRLFPPLPAASFFFLSRLLFAPGTCVSVRGPATEPDLFWIMAVDAG